MGVVNTQGQLRMKLIYSLTGARQCNLIPSSLMTDSYLSLYLRKHSGRLKNLPQDIKVVSGRAKIQTASTQFLVSNLIPLMCFTYRLIELLEINKVFKRSVVSKTVSNCM